jgi:hypothetical protein
MGAGKVAGLLSFKLAMDKIEDAVGNIPRFSFHGRRFVPLYRRAEAILYRAAPFICRKCQHLRQIGKLPAPLSSGQSFFNILSYWS